MRRSALPVLALALAACPPKDPENALPTVEDRALETPEDTPLEIALSATDLDGDPLTYRIEAQPESGTLTLVGPNATYTPNPDFHGTDSFTWVASDGQGDSPVATVSITITPVNDAPVIVADDHWQLVDHLLPLRATADDVDGDEVTLSWAHAGGPAVEILDTDDGPMVRPSAIGVTTLSITATDGTDDTSVTVSLRVMDLDAGDEHVVALRPDGSVWAWGDNGDEQLGDGTGEDWSFPVPVCTEPGADGPPCEERLTGAIRVAAGEDWSMALLANGTVLGWGLNSGGTLGGCATAGSCQPVAIPRPIAGLTNVVDIAAGRDHGVALKADGTVWTWGSNTFGQLGRGSFDDLDEDDPNRPVHTPAAVCADAGCTASLSNIVRIVAGRDEGFHTAAIDATGRVWTWGDGDDGMLGNGCDYTDTCDEHPVPTQVCFAWDETNDVCQAPLVNVTDVALGETWGLARLGTGAVVGWGNNFEGQLGTGCDPEGDVGCEDMPLPVPVCGEDQAEPCAVSLGRVTSLAAGEDHALVGLANGRALSWGENVSGQLGNGCASSRDCGFDIGIPQAICAPGEERPCQSDLADVAGLVGGGDTSFALLRDGTLLGWGQNDDGTAGDASAFAPFAIPIGQDADWIDVVAGYEHSLGLKADGRLFAWGNNDELAIGNNCGGDPEGCPEAWAPAQVLAADGASFYDDWVAIGVGEEHSLGIRESGFAFGWGNGAFGALAGNESSAVPAPLPGGPWAEIGGGEGFTVARARDGSLWAWGDGGDGQLGDGQESTSSTPVQVLGADGINPDDDWASFTVGPDFALAIKEDGTIWGWGEGGDGQLGNGIEDEQPTPSALIGPEGSPAPTDWVKVSAGDEFTVGLRATGSMWAWGEATDGALGDGCIERDDCSDVSTPIPVRAPDGGAFQSDWADVDAGWWHVVAVKANGTAWTWGEDNDGSLGDGLLRDTALPSPVCAEWDAASWTCAVPLDDVVHVSAGADHTLVIRADGSLWGWGDNAYGQLGTGGGEDVVTPSAVRW